MYLHSKKKINETDKNIYLQKSTYVYINMPYKIT